MHLLPDKIGLRVDKSPPESNVTNISQYKLPSPVLLNGQKYAKPSVLVIPSVGICGLLCDVKTKVRNVLSLQS